VLGPNRLKIGRFHKPLGSPGRPFSMTESMYPPVLATHVIEEKPRVSGWVFVAAFVAFISPIVAVTAYMTQMPAPKPVPHSPPAKPGTIKVTGPETVASATETPSASASAMVAERRKEEAPCTCMPPPRPKVIPTPTATHVKHEAPKCCAGETEMECAMRRSVGATCG